GSEDFRLVVRFEGCGLRLVPEPEADARFLAPGAAPTLIGARPRDTYGFKPREPDTRFVARYPRQPAVHDNADALEGQRGFRDRGREHDLAVAPRGRRNRPVLGVGIESPMKRHDAHRRIAQALA